MIIVEFGPDGRKDRYDDDLSRSIIEKVKDAKEFKILENFNIFIFFDNAIRIIFFDDFYNARLYPADYPSFEYFNETLRNSASIHDQIISKIQSTKFNFVIHMERNFKTEENKILKTINLAHEFQHAVQYVEKFEIFCISDVLYQASKNLIDIPFDSIQSPLEKDAIRISKKVRYDLYEKNRIDSFAEEIRKKKEALEKQVLVISEVSKEGYVPELKVGNKRKIPVLLLGGEELAGAKQNRVLNTTM